MTSIITRVIDSVQDKKLVLAGSHWSMGLDVGSSWTVLRIAMRFAMRDNFGLSISGTPAFFVGVMSAPVVGMTNGPLNDTTHFVGYHTRDDIWTRSTGPVRYSPSPFNAVAKVDGAFTTGGSSPPLISADPELRLGFWMQLTKGSPWSFANSRVNLTAGFVDMPQAGLISALNQGTGAAAAVAFNAAIGGSGYTSGTTTVAVDEASNGSLDAITVGWDRPYSQFEISDLFFKVAA